MSAVDLRVLRTLIDDLRRFVDKAERKLDAAEWFGHAAQVRTGIRRAQARDARAAAAKLTGRNGSATPRAM